MKQEFSVGEFVLKLALVLIIIFAAIVFIGELIG